LEYVVIVVEYAGVTITANVKIPRRNNARDFDRNMFNSLGRAI